MITINDFYEAKKDGNNKISVLTAYDYSTAKIMDEAGVDAILVGDSLGMVMLGYEDTLSVTVDDMIHHAKAVKRACKNAFVIVDMPFMSYEVDAKEAVKNAGRIIKETGANAVKLEGGERVADTIKAIVNANIPVMGHLGLTPQSVNIFGGFRVQGRGNEARLNLLREAKIVEEAGAFSITLECIPFSLAKEVTESLNIATIGIGAGSHCTGQVLVYQDMLNLYDKVKPKFVNVYANLGEQMKDAIKNYISDVKKGTFPDNEKHGFCD